MKADAFLKQAAIVVGLGDKAVGESRERVRAALTGLAEENLQARIRGAMVMIRSNHYGWLALATGNKSELAVGYCTLYGDMAGGFAVLADDDGRTTASPGPAARARAAGRARHAAGGAVVRAGAARALGAPREGAGAGTGRSLPDARRVRRGVAALQSWPAASDR